MKLVVTPGLNVQHVAAQHDHHAALRPDPDVHDITNLVLSRDSALAGIVNLQPDNEGALTLRIVETEHVKALVLDGNGAQLYP